jgi:hypothetical protein
MQIFCSRLDETAKDIDDVFLGVSTFEPFLRVVSNPTAEELNKCFEYGKTFASKTKTGK